MGFENIYKPGLYDSNYLGVNTAAIGVTDPPSPPQAQPAPATPAPAQPPAPQPNQPQAAPAPVQPQAPTQAPAAQAAKPAAASPDVEESELDVLLLKGDFQRVKTVKIAENAYIRVYAKKAGNPPAPPQPAQPQPSQPQPTPAGAKPA